MGSGAWHTAGGSSSIRLCLCVVLCTLLGAAVGHDHGRAGLDSIEVVADGTTSFETDWIAYRETQRELLATTMRQRPTTRAWLDKYAAWNKEMIRRMNSDEIELSSFYDGPQGGSGKVAVGSDYFDDLETFRGVVLFVPRGTGFANRAEGFMSAFLLAMSTGRVLFCDFGRAWPEIEILEQSPILPDAYWHNFERKEELLDLWIERTHGGVPVPEAPHQFESTHNVRPSVDFAPKTDLAVTFENDVFLNFTANVYSGVTMFYNPFMRERMEHWFGERSLHNDSTHILAVWLLPMPVAAIREAGMFALQHFGDKQTIGLHIRATESFAKDVPRELFFGCVESVLTTKSRRTGSYVVYLATDNAQAQAEAQAHFGDHVVWYADVPAVNDASKMNIRQRSDVMSRYVDLQLLSLCSDLVVTCSSSFSRMAVARANVAPKFVTFESKLWCSSPLTQPHQCIAAASSKVCSNRYTHPLDNVNVPQSDREELLLECMGD